MLLMRPDKSVVEPRLPTPNVVITCAESDDKPPCVGSQSARDPCSSLDRGLNPLEQFHVEIFRILRRLTVFERNRRLIKTLLPASVLSVLLEMHHKDRRNETSDSDEIVLYGLAKSWSNLEDEERVHISKALSACDLSKSPKHYIREYAITELLGSGAFGQVYKARKQIPAQTVYAIKEVSTTQPMFGHTVQEREKSIGRILNEVNIIRQQMRHPNIVRYYKTFIHDEKLYIVMEMLDGLSLTELIGSMRDKGERFAESRVWHIFIQLVVALRYLHREKGILHRDLSANNIMLGEGDKVTITDFGLARQKQWDTFKMISTVGTLVYSCPEIVQNIPYGEGVDIWALGCILYQICTYTPPFQAECILTVASRIVKGVYTPVAEVCPGLYSPLMDEVIAVCLTPDPTKRPDILGVATHLTEPILVELNAARLTAYQAKCRLKEFRDQFNPSCAMVHSGTVDQVRRNSSFSGLSGSGSPRTTSASTIRIAQTQLKPVEDPILGIVTIVRKFERLSRTPVVRNGHHQVLRQLIDKYV
ncbi:unnamed protein product [Echinostoma caproni]|uniref:Protein kinase domain-containing protein n=1 Tax=Echinostoma caproni TaxID=27848 RepID=A0A183AK35_9TREM|nr:unnamed protein product [Echinostoma caproni]